MLLGFFTTYRDFFSSSFQIKNTTEAETRRSFAHLRYRVTDTASASLPLAAYTPSMEIKKGRRGAHKEEGCLMNHLNQMEG